MKLLKVLGLTFLGLLMGVLIFSLVPFCIDKFIFANNVSSAINNSDWSSFLGSYIGGIIGGLCTLIAIYLTNKESRKLQENENLIHNRSYVFVEQYDNLGLKLEGYNSDNKVKLIETKNYLELKNYIKQTNKTIRLPFIIISTLDSKFIVNCSIKLIVSDINDENDKLELDCTVPIIHNNEEYAIMIYNFNKNSIEECNPQLINLIEINYFTSAGENIVYRHEQSYKNNQISIIETYSKINRKGKEVSLMNYKQKPVNWIIIKN